MNYGINYGIIIDLIPNTFQAVGNTTSGCYSPVLGKGLVFAYVPAIVDVPGNQGWI